ncbi:MAG: SPASM domain-containing protein [Holophagae bacterium]|nr:SPASM domain-containing protein [Holophagae bacterium]
MHTLDSLVLKPVLYCNANCSFCSSRLALHKDASEKPGIDLQGWKEVIRLFKIKGVNIKSLEAGTYNPPGFIRCKRPSRFCIILANGDIHPCNAIEYYHKPVVGNLKEKSLREWWTDPRWENIRETGTGWCQICPMKHHREIRLKSSTEHAISVNPEEK